MNLSGWKRASDARRQGVVAGERGQPADVADQHPGPLHVVERPVEGARDGGLDEALAQADPQVAAEHLDDVLGGQRVGAFEQGAQDRRLAGRPGGRSIAANAAATSGSVGLVSGGGAWPAAVEHVGDGDAEVGRAVVRLAERRARDVRRAIGHGRGDGRPAQAGGALVGLGERPAGQEDGGDRQLVGRQVPQVVGEERGLLGGPGRRREALGELAPATHADDGIPCRRWCSERGSRRP